MGYAAIVEIEKVAGCFEHKETKATFEYSVGHATDWDAEIGATHFIYMGDGSTRAARILKTVAYVAVDENDNGPVWAKWPIKHRWTREA